MSQILKKVFTRSCAPLQPKDVKNILIVRQNAIGDVILSIPLLLALRDLCPQAQVDYATSTWSAGSLKSSRVVNKIYYFPQVKSQILFVLELIKMITMLRRQKYDVVFSLGKSWAWGLFCRILGSKCVVGFDRKGEGFACDVTVDFWQERYEGDYYLDLVRTLWPTHVIPDYPLFLEISHEDKIKVDEKIFSTINMKEKTVALVIGGARNPGQNADCKRWPLEYYVQLVRLLLDSQIKVILVGGPTDKGDHQFLIEQFSDTDKLSIENAITHQFSLLQSGYLLSKVDCVVTHDCGPLHLASASGQRQIIALFGATSAKRYAPKNARVITPSGEFSTQVNGEFSSYHDNYGRFLEGAQDVMKKIQPHDVFEAVLNQLKDER